MSIRNKNVTVKKMWIREFRFRKLGRKNTLKFLVVLMHRAISELKLNRVHHVIINVVPQRRQKLIRMPGQRMILNLTLKF